MNQNKKMLRRNVNLFITAILDHAIPPQLRDSYWFMYLPMKIVFRDKLSLIINFKKNAFTMSKKEFSAVYKAMADLPNANGISDLNEPCANHILASVIGTNVLEAGCGRGYLSIKLSKKYKVTGVDIVLDKQLIKQNPQITFKQADIEKLPFKDKSFDTVICTHTLEHVQDIVGAIAELRRVTRKRLIIVVPKQRPYKYTFNLHIHFFPYSWSLTPFFGTNNKSKLFDLGDWLYWEDYQT